MSSLTSGNLSVDKANEFIQVSLSVCRDTVCKDSGRDNNNNCYRAATEVYDDETSCVLYNDFMCNDNYF